ncbi:MAG: hypothetical protein AB7I50_08225 [Vicinamibacterales bacterium]
MLVVLGYMVLVVTGVAEAQTYAGRTWYFPEGIQETPTASGIVTSVEHRYTSSTADDRWFDIRRYFSTWYHVANPYDHSVGVSIEFAKADESGVPSAPVSAFITVGPKSRATVCLCSYVGAGLWSAKFTPETGKAIYVDRSIYFDGTQAYPEHGNVAWDGSTGNLGIVDTANTTQWPTGYGTEWYFAHAGTTTTNGVNVPVSYFDNVFAIHNPSSTTANVEIKLRVFVNKDGYNSNFTGECQSQSQNQTYSCTLALPQVYTLQIPPGRTKHFYINEHVRTLDPKWWGDLSAEVESTNQVPILPEFTMFQIYVHTQVNNPNAFDPDPNLGVSAQTHTGFLVANNVKGASEWFFPETPNSFMHPRIYVYNNGTQDAWLRIFRWTPDGIDRVYPSTAFPLPDLVKKIPPNSRTNIDLKYTSPFGADTKSDAFGLSVKSVFEGTDTPNPEARIVVNKTNYWADLTSPVGWIEGTEHTGSSVPSSFWQVPTGTNKNGGGPPTHLDGDFRNYVNLINPNGWTVNVKVFRYKSGSILDCKERNMPPWSKATALLDNQPFGTYTDYAAFVVAGSPIHMEYSVFFNFDDPSRWTRSGESSPGIPESVAPSYPTNMGCVPF